MSGEALARQLKSARAKQTINGVISLDGGTITDHQGINDAFQRYYYNLYSSDSVDDPNLLFDFFKDLNIPTLSPDEVSALDAPLQQQEITAAIKSLQSRHSPGPDGLPSEFYATFAEKSSPILANLYKDSFARGAFPNSLNQAYITLLPKKDKNLLECGSYRLTLLLNSNYKILAKVLANRLERVLPNIIASDQTGFVKNRRSFSSIRRLFNILYTPSQANSECLLSMDAEKAFDRVEWDYLFEVLSRFGVGHQFLSWVKLLYACPTAMVLTNNHYSEPFRLHRGTRQGCPLCPLLFVLAIEPLAIAIRNNHSIHGISRNGIEHKLSLYADDLLLFVSESEVTIPSILDLFNKFGRVSGYKLNLHKSELLSLNMPDSTIAKINVPFKIAVHSFVYLGITVTKYFCDFFKENFSKLQHNVQQDLSKWLPFPLSLVGRVNVIKMSVLPKYLYLFQSLPVYVPNVYFKKLDSIISSFLWNCKKPRIRKEHLQKSKQDGGLALPNFRHYYWASNLCCLSFWMRYQRDDSGPA
uniref:Reverse transcriptase domain-containing protein n=1 Tax=Salarias fasciatus TaxID=181472 RepID=A0A672GJR5_SALFA